MTMRSVVGWLSGAVLLLAIGSCGSDRPSTQAATSPVARPAANAAAGTDATSRAPTAGARSPRAAPAPPSGTGPHRTLGEQRRTHAQPETAVLPAEESPADAKGDTQRVSLVRRPGKYPLIRREETIHHGADGTERTMAQREMAGDHLLVALRPGADPVAFGRALAGSGLAVLAPVRGTAHWLVRFPVADHHALAAARTQLAALPAVATVEPDYVVHASADPSDPSFPGQWALANDGQDLGVAGADIGARRAWAQGTGSRTVKVAVIDTGIDFTHPDLAANIWTNPGESGAKSTNATDDDGNGFIDDAHGWNFVTDSNDPSDDHFHGTHVSGTIGAVGNNAVGVSGVCWQVSIVPIKFLDGSGSGFTSDAVAAVAYATGLGVDVISASWGGPGASPTLEDAIATAGQHGILFVAAAGNDGNDHDSVPSYPASYPEGNIIAVAATDRTDHLPWWSDFGSTTVAIAAPGVDIMSTLPLVQTQAMFDEGLGTAYGLLSGTSMATPHVSGALALLKAKHPEYTAQQLRAVLLARADHLPALLGKVEAGARLDAGAMLDPAWSAAPRLALAGVAMRDLAGNGDGQADAGETVALWVSVGNDGSRAATGIHVAFASTVTGITVSVAGAAVRDLAPLEQDEAGTPISVRIASGVADGTVVTGVLTITSASAATVTVPYSFLVRALPAQPTVLAHGRLGFTVADPVRNVVYLLDLTAGAVLAVDTAQGRLVHRTLLPAGTPLTSDSALAVSPDGTRLAVTFPALQQYQEFALPAVAPQPLRALGLTPRAAVYGAGNRLFMTAYDSLAIGHPVPLGLAMVDAQGVVSGVPTPATVQMFESGFLRASPDGTRLWHINTAVIPTAVEEFAISGAPTWVRTSMILYDGFSGDAVFDAGTNRLLLGDGGISALATGALQSIRLYPLQSGQSGGNAVATTATDPYIYVPWEGTPPAAGIARFRRSDLAWAGSIPTPAPWNVLSQSIAETANGRLLYAKANSLFRRQFAEYDETTLLGLVGGSSLAIDVYPRASFTAASSATAPRTVTFDASATSDPDGLAIAAYTWDFGDGASGSGARPVHTYAANGTYQVTLTARDAEGLPGRVTSSVAVAGAALAAVPTAFPAAYAVPVGGSVAITLRGGAASGSALAYTVFPSSAGTLTGTPPTLVYHAPQLAQNVSFTFQVSSGGVSSAPATITVEVTAVEQPPVVAGQQLIVASGVATPINLATVDGYFLENLKIVSPPTHGQLSGTPPFLTYQSADQYLGSDAFTVATSDGLQWGPAATIGLTVTSGYTLTDLGLPSGPSSSGNGITDLRQIAITTADPTSGKFNAYTWKNGVLTGLAHLPGARNAAAGAINATGQVAGGSDAPGGLSHAVRWTGGVPADLGGPAGGGTSSARAINDSGVVVGTIGPQACRWDANGVAHVLDNPGSFPSSQSEATSVNATGSCVGQGQIASGAQHAFLWDTAGNATDLLPGAAYEPAIGVALLDDGTAICHAGYNPQLIYRVQGGVITLVGSGNVNGANQLGDLVGWRRDAAGTVHQTHWHGGVPIDLDVLMPSVTFAALQAINRAGEITGSYTDGTGTHACVLIPTVNRIPVITAGPVGPTAPLTTVATTLSVSASDPDQAPAPLRYTWSLLSGPAAVAFAPNGTTGAATTQAAFTVPGDYRVQVAVTDGAAVVPRQLIVSVASAVASLAVRPAVAIADLGDAVQYEVAVSDQFGLPVQQVVPAAWTSSGGGTIDGFGRLPVTAVGGPFQITAKAAGVSASAALTVAPALPAPWRHQDVGPVPSLGWASRRAWAMPT